MTKTVVGSLAPVFEPGFFYESAVHVALTVGGIVAVVSGVVGTFTVMRGQSFAGHSLADIGTAGGSAAFLLGVSPLYGIVAMNLDCGRRHGNDRHSSTSRTRSGHRDHSGRRSRSRRSLPRLGHHAFGCRTGATINVLFGSILQRRLVGAGRRHLQRGGHRVGPGVLPTTAPQLPQPRSGGDPGGLRSPRRNRLSHGPRGGCVALGRHDRSDLLPAFSSGRRPPPSVSPNGRRWLW